MKFLALRFHGPMQSWGIEGRFGLRDTAAEPTKSGVVGIVCNAMGRDREDPIDDVAGLKMLVRIDSPGQIEADFQTIGGGYPDRLTPITAEGGHTKSAIISRKLYINDGDFVVLLWGDDELVGRAAEAINAPARPLFMGRKSCPVPDDMLIGVLNGEDPVAVASSIPRRSGSGDAKIVVDDPDGRIVKMDYPISFSDRRRAYGARTVSVARIAVST